MTTTSSLRLEPIRIGFGRILWDAVRQAAWWMLFWLIAVGGPWLCIFVQTCGFIGCPSRSEFSAIAARGSIVDARGKQLGTTTGQERIPVALHDIPRSVQRAFIIVEDQRLFTRKTPLDWRGCGRAISRLLQRTEGCSTIPMQLARLAFVRPSWRQKRGAIGILRKLLEVRYAGLMMRYVTQEQILGAYLNTVPLAGGDGVEQASRVLFGRRASQLTIAQAAMIAGLARSPSFYDPRKNPKAARRRRTVVLRLMLNHHLISRVEFKAADAEPLRGKKRLSSPRSVIPQRLAISELSLICENASCPRDRRKIQINTTLDPTMQAAAILAMQSVPRRFRRIQGALIAIDEHTGAIRALVGGVGQDGGGGYNRVFQMRRQLGSTFKIFTYASALEMDSTIHSQVLDAPVVVQLGSGKIWNPRNYDRKYSMQLVSLKYALAQSLNAASVRLGQQVGLGAASKMAERLGIESRVPKTPAALLGAGEVSPAELARAFAVMANCGHLIPRPWLVSHVMSAAGETIWSHPSDVQAEVLSAKVCAGMDTLLSAVVDSGTAQSIRAAGVTESRVLAKTGTTSGSKDLWLAVSARGVTTIMWVGSDRPRSLGHVSSGTVLGPIWAKFFRASAKIEPK